MGWSYWFAWIVAAIAEIIAITGYIGFWWPAFPPWVTAGLTVIFLQVINLLTVKAFGELEFWLAIVKVIAIISLIALGIFLSLTGFVSSEGTTARVENLWAYQGFFPHGFEGIMSGLQMTIFAFAGMEIIGTMMAEAKDPVRMIPDAIRKIPWRILIFYIGTVTVLMMVTPWVDISPDQSPFVGMFSLVGLASAASLINFVVASSATSSSNSGIFATSRMLYGLAKNNAAPIYFGKLSSHHVPASAVLLATLLILCLSVILTITDSMMTAFQMVGSVAALIFIFVWSLILWAHLVYQRRYPEAHARSVFRMPLSRIMPYVILGFFGLVIYALSLDGVTRVALYVLPLWFVLLATCYRVKIRRTSKIAG